MRIGNAVLSLALASGCLGVSPEEARRRAIGDGDYELEEEHNPGTACLACHDRDFHPGGEVFALAGTVYLHPTGDDREGLAGVDVFVVDARGRELRAVTNAAGNFMFEVEGGDDGYGGPRADGRTKLGFFPEFPMRVWIEQGEQIRVMDGPIRREGSCAACHAGDPSASSYGRVYLLDPP